MEYLLGIDIGTSACKVAIFDLDGKVISQANEVYKVYYPQEGYAEQNPEEWWDAICKAIKTSMVNGKVDAKDIKGIGVDGQSWSAIAIDENGKVLTNTPIWMDTRAQDICDEWNETIGEEEIFKLCGNPLKPSYTTPKIGWYKKHMPDVYNNAYKILQSNSFIVYKLTGKISQEKSQGYGLHCFDINKCAWDLDMCEKMGIRSDLLPEISDCHDIIGEVTKDTAYITGLQEGTPVVAGGLDASCGALGVGVINVGETQEQGGQAGGMSICLDEAKADIRLILGCHVVPNYWLLQGGTVGGGGVMNWFEREFGAYEKLQSRETQKSSFALLDDAAAVVPAGSEGLLFLPYMAGERSPIWDPKAKGVYYGVDFSKTKGHFVRASLEGVAYSLKHNLDIAEKMGVKVDTLKSMGGAANSRLWTQIKSDITQKKIEIPSSDTATTLGAVILAGVGVGLYKDYAEAVERTVKVTREHQPNEDNKKTYEDGFARYLKIYPAVKEI